MDVTISTSICSCSLLFQRIPLHSVLEFVLSLLPRSTVSHHTNVARCSQEHSQLYYLSLHRGLGFIQVIFLEYTGTDAREKHTEVLEVTRRGAEVWNVQRRCVSISGDVTPPSESIRTILYSISSSREVFSCGLERLERSCGILFRSSITLLVESNGGKQRTVMGSILSLKTEIETRKLQN